MMPPTSPSCDPADRSALDRALALRDRDLPAAVDDAVRHGQFRLAFQPVFRVLPHGPAAPGAAPWPVFHESLARVLDETGRIVPASQFVHAVEETETGRLIDCLALERSLRHLAHHAGLRLAVNLSARSIGYPRWRRILARALDRDPGLGARLILEISERSAMRVPELTLAFMAECQSAGIAFALDDFGAGATRFRFLKRMPFDMLKLDGTLVQGVARDPDNQVAVRGLAAMAREFDFVTVAEQVETAEDAAFLASAGIDLAQGHWFGAPTLSPPWLETAPRGGPGPF